MTTLAQQLRTAREGKAWSVRELARRSGVATGTISGIENGHITHPRAQDLGALEGALDRLLAIAPESATVHLPAVLHADIHIKPGANPRTVFDSIDLVALATSIEQDGLLQPLVVRARAAGGVWLIAGERRHRAIGILIERGAWPADRPVPVNRRDDVNDEEHEILAQIENLRRVDLNVIDQAEHLDRLVQRNPDLWTTATLAERTGLDQRTIQQRLQLVKKLSPSVKHAARLGQISATQARTLMLAPVWVQDKLLAAIAREEPGHVTERDLIARIADIEGRATAKTGGATHSTTNGRASSPARGQGGPAPSPGSAHPLPPAPAEPVDAAALEIRQHVRLDEWIVTAADWLPGSDRYPGAILLRNPHDDESLPAGRYVRVPDEPPASPQPATEEEKA